MVADYEMYSLSVITFGSVVVALWRFGFAVSEQQVVSGDCTLNVEAAAGMMEWMRCPRRHFLSENTEEFHHT